MWELILAVGVATLVSAVCSVSEAALYSISWSTIEKLKRDNPRAGEMLHALRRDVEKPITAILTLNTIANTMGASVAGAAAATVYGPQALPLFAAVFTLIILVFSEIVPKTVGVAYAGQLAPWLARPLHWLVAVLGPVIWVLARVAVLVKPRRARPEATEADILAMVSLTSKSGMLKAYEESIITNILALDTKTVGEIMTPRTVVFSLSDTATVAQARESGRLFNHSRVPVYKDEDREEVIGIVHRRELLDLPTERQNVTPLGELARPVVFVLESMTLDKLLLQLLQSRSHLFVVLDEYGGLAGVVSLEDVVEEILGTEIVDETDVVADMRELARTRRKQLVEGRRGV